ncbi:thermonuclease family protein [Ramlibacter aurantiacus]|uniref:thermonuclease family protein n=1 Tax=Ramlibacter aurantiacus TaxID=2801330 RepID=UPI001F40E9BE|nr:thermonuclease family protein [Ramlibacter aurantiacus]
MPARRATCRLLLALLPLLAPPAWAEPRLLRGVVTHVTDGDSIRVRPADGGAPQAVRLRGIDAPEICQRHGRAARSALQERLLHQPVLLRMHGRDSYERLLADVAAPHTPDLGAWLVAQGHAWAAARGPRGRYAAEQALARSEGRGLWAQPRPLAPREFRRRHGRCA